MKRFIAAFLFCLIGTACFAQDLMDEGPESEPVEAPAPKHGKKPVAEPQDQDLPPPAPAGTLDNKDTAELQALDKITARVTRLEAKIDHPVTFASLTIAVKACRKAPPEDPPNTVAFLQIVEQKPGEEPHSVYSGWMFASSPALAAMDHPVYDIWLVDCKNAATKASSSPQ